MLVRNRIVGAGLAVFVLAAVCSANASAQDDMPASPRGTAATQIDGKWITIDYGRPILRGRRSIFGSGESYGKTVLSGAPVWRLGANQSTRLKTQVDLRFGDKVVPAGEYSLFADLSATGWTLVVSNHTALANYGDPGEGIWGSFGYSASKDVARIPMTVQKLDISIDEFSIGFYNVTTKGGSIGVWWDDTRASASFTVGGM